MPAVRVLAPPRAVSAATVNGRQVAYGDWTAVEPGAVEVAVRLTPGPGEVRLTRTVHLGEHDLATVEWPHLTAAGSPDAGSLTSTLSALGPLLPPLAAGRAGEDAGPAGLLTQVAATVLGALVTSRQPVGDWSVLVGYDLHGQRRDYRHLTAALVDLGATRLLESLWLLPPATAMTARSVHDALSAYVDADDVLVAVDHRGALVR